MTLGGLALAVGILVDDATVTIENIERHREGGHGDREAILDGAAEIACPRWCPPSASASCSCPCSPWVGWPATLCPAGGGVIFAMLASYVLSRTLVPTLAMYLLKPAHGGETESRNPLVRAQRAFERGFERFRNAYRDLLTTLVDRRRLFIPLFLGTCLLAFCSRRGSGRTSSRTPTAAVQPAHARQTAPASRRPRG